MDIIPLLLSFAIIAVFLLIVYSIWCLFSFPIRFLKKRIDNGVRQELNAYYVDQEKICYSDMSAEEAENYYGKTEIIERENKSQIEKYNLIAHFSYYYMNGVKKITLYCIVFLPILFSIVAYSPNIYTARELSFLCHIFMVMALVSSSVVFEWNEKYIINSRDCNVKKYMNLFFMSIIPSLYFYIFMSFMMVYVISYKINANEFIENYMKPFIPFMNKKEFMVFFIYYYATFKPIFYYILFGIHIINWLFHCLWIKETSNKRSIKLNYIKKLEEENMRRKQNGEELISINYNVLMTHYS